MQYRCDSDESIPRKGQGKRIKDKGGRLVAGGLGHDLRLSVPRLTGCTVETVIDARHTSAFVGAVETGEAG